MKQYFILLLTLFSVQIHAWYSTNKPMRLSLNTNANFGKKHFIVGYSPSKKTISTSKKIVAQDPKKLIDKNGHVRKAFFSPNDNLRSTLLYLINQEKKQISIAMFAFTDKDFANALAQAQQRGVQVDIIVDPSNVYGRYNKLANLQSGRVNILVYNPNRFNKKTPGCMHNKFVIFQNNIKNKSLVWTGSFNFTRAAHQRNQENIVLLDDRKVIQKFAEQFNELKKYADVYHAPKAAV